MIRFLCGVILLIFATACCDNQFGWQIVDGSVWRTSYHIVYRGSASLGDSIIATLNSVDASLSAFNPRSITAAVNRGDTSVLADRRFREVFATSKLVWEASDGRFDPTLGAALRLWGFGPGGIKSKVVTADEIDSVARLIGLDSCFITADGHIIKKHPRTEFNFSAIAKGYAADCVAAMLRRSGVEDYMVEIGGEIALNGANRECKPWRIMIDAPVADASAAGADHHKLAFISPESGGVATSGNYRNYRVIEGHGRVGHTFDPHTGHPAREQLLSATVTAPTAMLADALATTCMTSGVDDARRLMARFPEAGCLVVLPDSTIEIIGKFPNIR